MTHTTSAAPCSDVRASSEAGLPPANPHYAPRYHFGMLLGVDDFETEQAYHRGKQRLHNAWLHGDGVVWGMAVSVPTAGEETLRGEIQVDPGLALDAAGNELHLDASACVNVGAWYEAHKNDPDLDVRVQDDEVHFDVHVIARFRSCLTRPVPAMVEPCEGARGDTAFSRSFETVELVLRPGLAPDPLLRPYHRLRVLFALEAAQGTESDQEVLDVRAAILARPAAEQPQAYLEAFRRFAALDEMDLRPRRDDGEAPPRHFPVGDRPPVVLANVSDIVLHRSAEDGEWTLLGATVHNTVRAAHVATATIQELLCGPLFSATAGNPPSGNGGVGPAPPVPDAGGPRADPESLQHRGERITFTVDRPLLVASADARAVAVSVYDRRDGWTEVDVREVEYDADGRTVTIALRHAPRGNFLRVIARGTGPFPFLGRNGVPFAGETGGPPGTTNDGNDFVVIQKLRS